MDDAIRLGIEDLDPYLVQNWCHHLKIEYVSVSPLGQMIRLPSLGMKRLSCAYARYRCESVSINTAASGFVQQNCLGCKHHKQVSLLNFVTFGKPWGWIVSLLFRTRASTIRFILKHSTMIIITLFCLFVLPPIFALFSVYHADLFRAFSQIDQLFGLRIYDKNVLTAIAQINATVFALAFTIPIIATQLEKYRSEISMFSGYHLYYMLLFIFSIFFPILLPEGSNLGYATSIIVSFACLLLLIPYLKWVKESLDPERIIKTLRKAAFSNVDNHNEKDWKASIEKLNQIIIRSLSEKDYGTFSKAFEVLPELARHCFDRKFMIRDHPSQGCIYIGREITRISELAIDDRTATQITSEKILLMDTMHVPADESNERTFPLKLMEQTGLSWLAKLAIERKNNINAMHPIANLLKSSSFIVYESDFGRQLASTFQLQTINFLLTMPEEVVDWAYSLNESEYKVKYGGGDLKIALLGIAAKFYLEYKKKLEEKKKGEQK